MNPRKKLLITGLFFLFYFCIAECPAIRGEYSFDSWTTDNGLPQNGVREITQTPDGYLWFTTFDGLVRFDGVKFTTFNKGNTKGIINSRFTGVYCDKTGTLYATTVEDGVLTVYKDGVFSSYTSAQVPGNYIEKIKPDKNGEVRFLVVEEKNFVRTWYYLRNGEFVISQTFDKNDKSVEYAGKSGTLWTLNQNNITEFRNGKTTVYKHELNRFDYSKEAFEDSRGGLWIGGFDLIRLQNGKIENFRNTKYFPEHAEAHSFWEEDDGSVWFVNGGKSAPGLGLVRYKDGKFESFGIESGLSDDKDFQRLQRSRRCDLGGDEQRSQPIKKEDYQGIQLERRFEQFGSLSDLP